ncbi:MAG: potassium-transporting ATPase subunit KdpC [Alphaproteobacteria bacterium]|nr:potassium-transporting ATPase subunit KdpC [Alphaproteobacteria bacterium]
MFEHLARSFLMMVVMTVLTGLIYPLAVTATALGLFPFQAHGSLIRSHGRVIGSVLIEQPFSSTAYFHGRPSATTPPYNAASSGGSNLGPTSLALARRVRRAVRNLAPENPGVKVPEDLVTASGSGVDPDISPAGALFQVPAVAAARNLPLPMVRAVVQSHIENRVLGIFGEPHVNVLELNLALDRLSALHSSTAMR